MLSKGTEKLDGLRTYIDGKMKRYNLLFSVNGGAFAIAELLIAGWLIAAFGGGGQ